MIACSRIHAAQKMTLEHTDVFLFWLENGNATDRAVCVGHFESAPNATAPNLTPEQASQVCARACLRACARVSACASCVYVRVIAR